MSRDIILDSILQELRAQGVPPLSMHEDGNITYIVYGAITVGGKEGYPIFRTTENSVNHIYFDKGFLLESDRVSGANGSTANVDVKADRTNALLLLTNPTLIYG